MTLAFLVALPLATSPVEAGNAYGDPQRGHALATELCSPCHAVGEAGASPDADAPPFREVVQRYPVENLEEALAEGIIVGHDAPMPQFTFAPEQIDDLLAYLDGLTPQ